MKLQYDAVPRGTSDFWYDLVDGGYFNPEEFLDGQKDIDKVNEAIKVLEEYNELVAEEI